MSWVVSAVVGTVGSAVIGGIASNKASKRAAEGQENALAETRASIGQARGEVKDAFAAAEQLQNQGFQNALGGLFGGAERQIAPFQEGNVQAQNTLIGGLQQQQNALLGNAPVDLSGFQAQRIPFEAMSQPQMMANQGQLTPLGGQFQGPLQQAQGTIADQIAGGSLTFADMTPAQREQFRQERQTNQDFNFGIGGEGR